MMVLYMIHYILCKTLLKMRKCVWSWCCEKNNSFDAFCVFSLSLSSCYFLFFFSFFGLIYHV